MTDMSAMSRIGAAIGCRRTSILIAVMAVVGLALVAGLDKIGNDYSYLAGYTILQYAMLATAWNILGGYAGYVNFGSAGFFAIGAYTSVVLNKLWGVPVLVCLPVAALIAGLVGLAMGYLTLRLRGVFFSIATLALAIVLQTAILNWPFVGGSRGAYIMRPQAIEFFGSYARFLFILMLVLAAGSALIARSIEQSWIGRGLAALRDDEVAAECSGVPALPLKLFATTVSGTLMGIAGAPFAFFVSYVDPHTVFSLSIAVNTIAMPLIGGMATWLGPIIGAVLLGTLQQAATVMISSSANLLLVGFTLILFVAIAPNGILGMIKKLRETRHADR
ncbi:branched-chain amino acid transport system permease protein [Nitrobacteraceae bacterium AZCC 2161]